MVNQPSLFDLPQPVGTPAIPRHVLIVGTIYHEPNIEAHARGREILLRFPQAERIEVPSHWNIPSLHGNEGGVRDWLKIKREALVVGVKKGMTFLPYTRSCDWVAPSHSNGCGIVTHNCYVPRRKGFANPISTFVNIEQIQRAIVRHAQKAGPKTEPTTAGDTHWIYELGCNSDLSLDAAICDNAHDLIALFRGLPNARDVRHQVRQPRAAPLRPAAQDADALLADAAAHEPRRRWAHQFECGSHRGHQRVL